MPGVVITPALCTSTPTAARPSATRSAIHRLDCRVSCPITACGFLPSRSKSCPRARPIRYVLCLVSGNSPATPRMPSVPNNWRLGSLIERRFQETTTNITVDDKRFAHGLDVSMRWTVSGLLHQYRYAHRSSLHDLHQGIGNVDIGGENRTAASAGSIDRIGRRGIDFLDMKMGTRDGDTRGISIHSDNLLSLRKYAGDARMNLDLAREPGVKGEMQLAGQDLHHADITWMAYLLRAQIKSSFARFNIAEIDFRVNLLCLQLTDYALRSANPHLGFGNEFRTDLQVRGNVLKHHWSSQCDLRRLLLRRNQKPHSRRQCQGQDLKPEIVQHVMPEESDHARGSDPRRGSETRWSAASRKPESSVASGSSSLFEIGVGNATGAM